ncbi:MAG: hypothetical protein LH468_00975, partial [Nocardioides sp.]|nr:hypothetical protein [Nocardioides sp.]
VWAVRLGPVVLAVAVLVAVLLALTTPPPKMANDGRTALPAPLSRAPTSATQDPETWVTWYAAGRLHLGATVVRVRAVTQLVGVSGGAVYANAEGQVVLVRPTGERTRLGLTNSSSTLVASADGALVGWADIGRSDARVLTVVDGADGRSRRTLALSEDDDARPVGLLGDRMYVVRFGRTYGWQLRDAELRPVAEVPLLTVAGGQVALGPLDTSPPSVGITSIDPADRVPEGSSWLRVPGEAATLSPDGAIVLVRTTDGDVRLRDLATGRDLPSGLAASEVARAVEVGSQGRVAYVVARRAQRPETDDEASSFGSPVTVRTCTLSVDRTTMTCESVALVSGPSALPLLAR